MGTHREILEASLGLLLGFRPVDLHRFNYSKYSYSNLINYPQGERVNIVIRDGPVMSGVLDRYNPVGFSWASLGLSLVASFHPLCRRSIL